MTAMDFAKISGIFMGPMQNGKKNEGLLKQKTAPGGVWKEIELLAGDEESRGGRDW